jgi:hypothetical protein
MYVKREIANGDAGRRRFPSVLWVSHFFPRVEQYYTRAGEYSGDVDRSKMSV